MRARGGDISWHNVDEELHELAKAASNSGNTLLFGIGNVLLTYVPAYHDGGLLQG